MPTKTNSILSDEDRLQLLEALRSLGNDADAHEQVSRIFLPLEAHATALLPSNLVVRGGRGAGKTALFHVLRELSRPKRQADLAILFPSITDLSVRWFEGFGERGKQHPSTEIMSNFGADADDTRLRTFWLGHLIGTLASSHPHIPPPPGRFMSAWRNHNNEPGVWVDEVQPALGALTTWLDKFDDCCIEESHWAIVTYDHLDKIGITDQATRRRFASSLLTMWLSLTNRYDRLRGKIFLREDLFQSSLSSSADASKLESRSVSLNWNTQDLYRMLIKHMAAVDDLRAWMMGGQTKIPLIFISDALGWAPPASLPEHGGSCSQQVLVEKLAGKLMGSGVKKGYTHRWIPNHLQDAHGAIVPRSFLNLIGFSAEHARERSPRARHGKLIHPMELRAALEKTSKRRQRELAEEHPVVRRLHSLEGETLFLTRSLLISRLREPAKNDDGFGHDGVAVFDELIGLGVLKLRSDGRVDVPDLYRFGFGIKRKGGVARPR